jgi:Uma2 family endonuclease
MAIDALTVAGPAEPMALPVASTGESDWPNQGQWTYDALLALPDDGNRYEIIDGVLYVSPPPSPKHQDSLLNLSVSLMGFIRGGGRGRLFLSPVGLLMPHARPVQPDAFFLKTDNPAQIDWERHVEGVPDLVIEVASPSTAGYDRREKQDAYARAGVLEYWIVDPWGRTIEVLLLDRSSGAYHSLGVFRGTSRLPTAALERLPHSVDELLG